MPQLKFLIFNSSKLLLNKTFSIQKLKSCEPYAKFLHRGFRLADLSDVKFHLGGMRYAFLLLLLSWALSLAPCAVANAESVTLQWESPDGPVAGYKIYYGSKSRKYDYKIDIGNHTSCTISGLQKGKTYYFAASAYAIDGNKSGFSKEIAYTVPVSNPKVVKLWYEAEEGDIYKTFVASADRTASEGQFVWAPNGKGDYLQPSNKAGYAEYVFDAPVAGKYVIWAKVLAADFNHNSFFIFLNGRAYALWDTRVSRAWIWDQVSNRGGNDPVTFYLEAGEHTLTIKQREAGAKIDRILITNDVNFLP